MAKNHTIISISHLTKDELDKLKETYGNVSYERIITSLIVEHYKKKNNK